MKSGPEIDCLFIFLLFPLHPQMILQPRQDLTRTMVIKPSDLVAPQPPCTAAALYRRIVDVEVFLDRTRDQLSQLRRRQHGGPDFSPAASPDSGTTRRAGPGFGDDARRSSSAPGSRPGPPPPWLVGNILRSDAPPWPRGPVPSVAPRDRRWKDRSHV